MTRILARDVLRSAAVVFEVPIDDLIGRRRDMAIARPRAMACKAIRTLCPHTSYPAIGRMLGGRDHTTILHNLAKLERDLVSEPDLAEAFGRLLQHAGAGLAALEREIVETEARLAALKARLDALLSPDPLAQTGA